MAGMPDQVPGTTLHADWFGAWEDSVQDAWWTNCINQKLDCSDGVLGDGRILARNAYYPSTPPARRLIALPPRP